MKRAELRTAAMERAGHRCEFHDCRLPTSVHPLEMAHIEGLGMGGNRYGDRLDNVVILCRFHHDWLDCRIIANMRRYENATILRGYLRR